MLSKWLICLLGRGCLHPITCRISVIPRCHTPLTIIKTTYLLGIGCPLRGAQTLNISINSTKLPFEKLLRHSPHISRHHKTLTHAVRHQQTPANAIWCQPQPSHILEQPFWESGTACWSHLVSVGVGCCPELSRDTWRSCLWANVYAYVYAWEKMFIL